jgi:hypothetical protein
MLKLGGINLSPEGKQDHLIEEYKTLRQEIMENFKRKNSFVIYAIIATATIFGFALEYPSPFVFLLPLIIIIPLSYRTLAENRAILRIGTYIFVVIESKLENLHWETYNWKRREKPENNKSIKRGLTDYLLFVLLGGSCIILSIWYTLVIDNDIHSFISNLISVGELQLTNVALVAFWVLSGLYLGGWILKMRDCSSARNQECIKKEIVQLLNPTETE